MFSVLEREAGEDDDEVMGFQRLLSCLLSNKEKEVFKDLKSISIQVLCVAQKIHKRRVVPLISWRCFPLLRGW